MSVIDRHSMRSRQRKNFSDTFALEKHRRRLYGAFVKLKTFVFLHGQMSPPSRKLESANRLRGQRTADCFLSRAAAGLRFNLITSAPSPPSRVTLSTFLITPRIRSSLPLALRSSLSALLTPPCSIYIHFHFRFSSFSRAHVHTVNAHIYRSITPFPLAPPPLWRVKYARVINSTTLSLQAT